MATRLVYDAAKPPVSLIAIIEAAKQLVSASPSPAASIVIETSDTSTPRLHVGGAEFVGTHTIIRFLSRVAPSALHLYGTPSLNAVEEAVAATTIDFFVDFSRQLINKDSLATNAATLNEHLTSRSVLVGQDITIADLIVLEQLLFNVRWNSFQKDQQQYPALFRWYRFLISSSIYGRSLNAIAEVNNARRVALYEQSKFGSFALGDDAQIKPGQKIVTRFPPEPSGYLHIGHAKAGMLNYYYAREYNGSLIVRFDDTNPSKEKDEYVNSILNDIATLGIKYDRLTYTSDYFDKLEELCTKMITMGKAYVDDTPVEQMREERMHGTISKSRERSVEENLELWEEMKKATEKGLKCAVRAKIDMAAKNKTLRDPTIYRCNIKTPHHRTGTKYKVYPTYDFCCPIVDSLEDVSHVLRTIEYRDRNEQYYWMLRALGMREPIIRDYARLNFQYTLMSKRKLQWFVDQKLVTAWNDPRFPTVQGMIRRGMTVAAITEFMRLQGFSINVNYMQWDKIWTINKKIIDPVAHRYTALTESQRVPLTLTNVSTTSTFHSAPLHPKDVSIGSKMVPHSSLIFIEQEDARLMKNGEEITLMTWGNAIIDSIDMSGEVVTAMKGRLHLEGDVKKTDKKVTWLGGEAADFVPLNLVEFDHLITVEKLEEDMEVADVVRSPSRFDTMAVGEPALRNVKQGQIVQLNRKGFYRVDEISPPPSSSSPSSERPLQLFLIPDGREKQPDRKSVV